MLEEQKIQAGMQSVANEDLLLMCRSYKVLYTSHILLALPFLCPSLHPDFKIKKKNKTQEKQLCSSDGFLFA